MALMALDTSDVKRLKEERAASGADRFDEVWEGVYMMAPLVNNEHQYLAAMFGRICLEAVQAPAGGMVYIGVNVSDRERNWRENYRCPDVAVFLPGNKAKDCRTHWFGGPDLAIEIVSPKDRTRDKLEFYARAGVRELLRRRSPPLATGTVSSGQAIAGARRRVDSHAVAKAGKQGPASEVSSRRRTSASSHRGGQ